MTLNPRYTRPQMAEIWSDEYRFQKMLDVEIAATAAMAEEGLIPKAAAQEIAEKARFSVPRIREIEQENWHETLAFLTAVSENLGESGRFLHQGMTSSDVLDTAFSLQLREASILIEQGLESLLAALKKRIIEHRATPCIGRSHGIHAEPTTFGLKLAGHYTAFKRNLGRLRAARDEISVCAVSGPVGTFSMLPPSVETQVAKRLGLSVEPVSTQVIPRDRHALFFSILAVIAGSVENLATEIRHLQRSEVAEVEEFFHSGQKGSSAMPHKRNPILSESTTGLARIVRATVTPALENITLWHERDMSHSSVERFIAPQATAVLDFILNRLAGVIERLIVYPDRMQQNIDRLNGLTFSQPVLLALTDKGIGRETSYKIVQRNAMQSWETGEDFRTLLEKDADMPLDSAALAAVFDQGKMLRHTDIIIDRALA